MGHPRVRRQKECAAFSACPRVPGLGGAMPHADIFGAACPDRPLAIALGMGSDRGTAAPDPRHFLSNDGANGGIDRLDKSG